MVLFPTLMPASRIKLLGIYLRLPPTRPASPFTYMNRLMKRYHSNVVMHVLPFHLQTRDSIVMIRVRYAGSWRRQSSWNNDKGSVAGSSCSTSFPNRKPSCPCLVQSWIHDVAFLLLWNSERNAFFPKSVFHVGKRDVWSLCTSHAVRIRTSPFLSSIFCLCIVSAERWFFIILSVLLTTLCLKIN